MKSRYLILIASTLLILAAIINEDYFYVFMIILYTANIWLLDKTLDNVTETLEEMLK